MYIIIWKYKVKPESENKFIDYYKSDGIWAKFFERDPNFIGVDFYYSEEEKAYLTIDNWIDEESFRKFKELSIKEYEEIDKLCEGFTSSETFIGSFRN